MLCGTHFKKQITCKEAILICRKFNLTVQSKYGSTKECLVDDELKTWKRKGQHNHLYIEVQKKRNKLYILDVRGSLHKFYHDINSKFFTGLEVKAALDGLNDLFEIDLSNAELYYLEVGANLSVPFSVFEYLDQNLLYHGKKGRQEMKGNPKSIGFIFNYDDYEIKCYEKAEKVIRFEVKYFRDKLNKRFAIKTISDLSCEKIINLAKSNLPEWNQVELRGSIDVFNIKNNPSLLTQEECEKILKYTSTAYQQGYNKELKNADTKKKEALRQEAYRLKQFCSNIFKGDRSDGVHVLIKELLQNQIDEFIKSWKNNVTFSHFDKTRKS